MTTYTYNLDTDFSGSVNTGRLRSEIADDPAITTLLSSDRPVSVDGGTRIVSLMFEAALSSSEETALNALVAAHDGSPPSPPKILRYVTEPGLFDPTVAPVDLDYTTGLTRRLHAKRTVVLGEVTQVDWYANYDDVNDVHSDLILKVSITYTRNPLGLPLKRDTVRTWVAEDESDASPTKATTKYYRGNERTVEIKRRATNALSMQNTIGLGIIVQDQMTNYGKTYDEAVAIGLGWADEWYIFFEDKIRQFESTNSRSYFDAIQDLQNELPEVNLQWSRDTPGFLDAVKAEVNFGGWT